MTHLSNSSLVHSKWLLISVDQRWIWLNQVVSSNHELHCNKIDGLKLDTNLSSISAILWHEQVLWINFLNYKKPRNKTHLWTSVLRVSHCLHIKDLYCRFKKKSRKKEEVHYNHYERLYILSLHNMLSISSSSQMLLPWLNYPSLIYI
jgi:hypothetical protein